MLDQVNFNSYKVVNRGTAAIKLSDEDAFLKPMQSGAEQGGEVTEMELLSRILKDVNEKYGTDFSDEDRLIAKNLSKKLLDNAGLEGSINNNARDVAKVKFDELFENELVEMVNNHFGFYQKVSGDDELHKYVKDRMFDLIYRKVKK